MAISIGTATFSESVFDPDNGFMYYEFVPVNLNNKKFLKFIIHYECDSERDATISTNVYNHECLYRALLNLSVLPDDVCLTSFMDTDLPENIICGMSQCKEYWDYLMQYAEIPELTIKEF